MKSLRREVTVPATKESLDYALLVDGQPQAIVEAKALRHTLTGQHAAQCVQYASVLGVRWCLIINGVWWAIYDAHAKGPLEEKRVADVRLEDDPAAIAHAWSVLSLFSRDALARSNPLASLLIERVVTDELARPDSPAVQTLRRAIRSRFGERVSGQAVVTTIARLTRHPEAARASGSTRGSPAAPDAEHGVSDTEQPPRRPRKARADASRSPRIRLADLVEAGLLPADAALEARVEGVTHVARLRDGQIDLNGTLYATPSAASKDLRHRQAFNGWVDWRYKGELLAELRGRMPAARDARPDAGEQTRS